MIVTRAPGKLFIAGEYAVVSPSEPAVLVAVDRCITVRLSESEDAGRIHSAEYGRAPLVWRREDDGEHITVDHRPTDYVLSAISTVEELRAAKGAAPRYFDLDISSELDDASGRKFGLGSSGAVTVATIAALNEFYSLGLSPAERFKLALLATIAIAPNASGGDLAASTFGGWIRYSSPDRAALRAHRETHGVASALRCPAWSGAGARRVRPPKDLHLLVGWTGSPASTEHLVQRVHTPGESKPRPLTSFTAESRTLVDELVAAFDADDAAAAMAAIRGVRSLLQRLGESSGSAIETEQLHLLCDTAEEFGAAAKPSGAGGGDCGIALLGTEQGAPGQTGHGRNHSAAASPGTSILTAWESHGIRHLDLDSHPEEGDIDDF